jgi:hypothetical protein
MHLEVAGGMVVAAFGLWWGHVVGLTYGLVAHHHRQWAGWLCLSSGALVCVFSIWLAANSGSPSNTFAVRLLNPAWIGAPFLWSLPLMAWSAWLLLRSRRANALDRENPIR